MKTKLFTAVAAALTLAACGTKSLPFEGTEWKLVRLNGVENPEIFDAEPDSFNIIFGVDGPIFSGTGACNRIMGPYILGEDGAIEMGHAAMTRMACLNMEFEDEYVQAINSVNRYKVEGDRLTLYHDQTPVAEFCGTAAAEEQATESAEE